MIDREPTDVVALAIAALADVPLSPEHRLREVAGLAIAMNAHEESYRAAEVDQDEIEEGCRAMGRISAGMARMRFPVEV